MSKRPAGIRAFMETFDNYDPPHRIEPERLADSLIALWRRAERSMPSQP